MKILWVKANKLLPLHSGGDIRSYHMARHLAERHELCFLSYYAGSSDAAYDRQLQEQFPGACCIATGRSLSSSARFLDYVSRLGDPAPYAVSRFQSPAVRKKIGMLLAQERCDVAVCDFLDAAVNFAPSHVPVVLFQHNVESEIWRRHAETEANPVRRQVYRMEARKMHAYEESTVREFRHVIAVSEHDKQLMSAWTDASKITVIPTGVDLSQYKPEFSDGTMAPLVMFVGAMDWEPNVDAMEYFCKEIWPAVLAAAPSAKLRIVGRNPVRRVKQLMCDSVTVTGRVPSVIDQLREAAAVIVPLRIGGGTRLKIYEAMAAGKAIVSTSVGAEGLDVDHGQDIILADGAREFADAVLKLLNDGEIRRRYERAAAEKAARYNWPMVAARFEEVLGKVIGRVPAMRDVQCELPVGRN